jgi:plasmid stabilization system protein ParE
VPKVVLAPDVLDDFDRFLDHLKRFKIEDGAARIAGTVAAFQLLTHSPLIGRLSQGGNRELVIGYGSRGYVAIYRYISGLDTVFILAVRSQIAA